MNLGAVVPLISGTTAHPSGTTVEYGGQERDRPERYCRGGWAVLPLVSGTATLLPLRSTALSDTKKDPSNRGGTSTKPQRYYDWGLLAVLPLWSGTTALERYYRL